MAPGSLHGRFLLPKPPKGVRGGGHPPSLIAISAEMGSSEGREGRRGLLASARLQPHAQPCDRPEPWCFRTRPLASSSHPTVRETEPHRWGRDRPTQWHTTARCSLRESLAPRWPGHAALLDPQACPAFPPLGLCFCWSSKPRGYAPTPRRPSLIPHSSWATFPLHTSSFFSLLPICLRGTRFKGPALCWWRREMLRKLCMTTH